MRKLNLFLAAIMLFGVSTGAAQAGEEEYLKIRGYIHDESRLQGNSPVQRIVPRMRYYYSKAPIYGTYYRTHRYRIDNSSVGLVSGINDRTF